MTARRSNVALVSALAGIELPSWSGVHGEPSDRGTEKGVSPSDQEWTVDAAHAGWRLDRFLAAPERLGSRAKAATAIERGKVFLNGKEIAGRDGGLRLFDRRSGAGLD